MRPPNFLLYNACANLSTRRLPGPTPSDARKSARRRMEDQIESLYNKACKANDLEAASDLLALLEKWFARRSARAGRERRVDRAALQRVRRRLEQALPAQKRSG
jgi:hypothetical protein